MEVCTGHNLGYFCLWQETGDGSNGFADAAKYKLQELQVPTDELPHGVDAQMREVSAIDWSGSLRNIVNGLSG